MSWTWYLLGRHPEIASAAASRTRHCPRQRSSGTFPAVRGRSATALHPSGARRVDAPVSAGVQRGSGLHRTDQPGRAHHRTRLECGHLVLLGPPRPPLVARTGAVRPGTLAWARPAQPAEDDLLSFRRGHPDLIGEPFHMDRDHTGVGHARSPVGPQPASPEPVMPRGSITMRPDGPIQMRLVRAPRS